MAAVKFADQTCGLQLRGAVLLQSTVLSERVASSSQVQNIMRKIAAAVHPKAAGTAADCIAATRSEPVGLSSTGRLCVVTISSTAARLANELPSCVFDLS